MNQTQAFGIRDTCLISELPLPPLTNLKFSEYVYGSYMTNLKFYKLPYICGFYMTNLEFYKYVYGSYMTNLKFYKLPYACGC